MNEKRKTARVIRPRKEKHKPVIERCITSRFLKLHHRVINAVLRTMAYLVLSVDAKIHDS